MPGRGERRRHPAPLRAPAVAIGLALALCVLSLSKDAQPATATKTPTPARPLRTPPPVAGVTSRATPRPTPKATAKTPTPRVTPRPTPLPTARPSPAAALPLRPLPTPAVSGAGQYRALWADSFHDGFKTPEQTQQLVALARKTGCNALIVEVRKTGDAYYRGGREPLARDVAPGYDPLAHLLALCHDQTGGQPRIEVHAWIVVYRVAKHGVTLPANHVLSQHPDWICSDVNGKTREELNLYADPGVPGVIEYTAAVAADIVRGYDVDGLHLDYVRYPASTWGYNAIALDRFRRLYGRTFRPKPDDPEWGQFRRDQVTAMVRAIHAAIRAVRPRARLSVAGIAHGAPGADYTTASPYRYVFQDWAGWLQEGVIDGLFLMNYKRELSRDQARDFRAWSALAGQLANGRHVVIGAGGYMQAASLTLAQLSAAAATPGVSGVAIYSYAVPTLRSAEQPAFWSALGGILFRQPEAPPRAQWIEYPRHGILSGRALDAAGRPVDSALVAVNGPARRAVRADGNGYYVFVDLPPGRYNARATLSATRRVDGAAVVGAGLATALDLRERRP